MVHTILKADGSVSISKENKRIGCAKQKKPEPQDNTRWRLITTIKKSLLSCAGKEKGVYFIRNSYKKANEKELWDIYNTIREVESTFRVEYFFMQRIAVAGIPNNRNTEGSWRSLYITTIHKNYMIEGKQAIETLTTTRF